MVTLAAKREAVAHLCSAVRGERAAGVFGSRGGRGLGSLPQHAT